MSNYIKNLIKTRGWKEIEAMAEEAIRKCDNAEVNENLPSDDFKINVLANRKTALAIREFIKRVRLSSGNDILTKKSYK